MSYTKRTCNKCGMRRPQPEMTKRTESTGLSASTNLNRKNSTRIYSGRKKTVFYCKGCEPTNYAGIFLVMVAAVIVTFIMGQ